MELPVPNPNPAEIIIEPVDIDAETLRRVFDAACFETGLDDDGDLFVKEDGIRYLVVARAENSTIQMFAFFPLSEGSDEIENLRLCNRINDQFQMVRASLHGAGPTAIGNLVLDYCLVTSGGVSAKAISMTFRRFTKIVWQSLREASENNLLG